MAEIKDPENTIILETTKGKVVIALMPDLAPGHVARIKELAREKAKVEADSTLGQAEKQKQLAELDGKLASLGQPASAKQ